jgi:hypothetical protein
MKTRFAAILAGMLFAASAQATVVTFNFTATITSVKEMVNPFSGTEVASSTLAGDPVALGHTVRGTFSFDTATPRTSGGTYDWGTAYTFEAAGDTLNAAQFAFEQNSIGFSTTDGVAEPRFYHFVEDRPEGYDALYLSVSASRNGGTDIMSVNFEDLDGVAFDGAKLPETLPLAMLESAVFEYDYLGRAADGSQTYLKAVGALTSVEQVSSVPEPTTYAMFAAGLTLLAWRRKRG